MDRDGVEIHYEVFGSGDTTLLMIPPAPITHSRIWKGLVPYLARHYRVVTVDGRGNGGSDRPTDPAEHTGEANLGDIVGVLDATGTTSAVVVAHCHANWWAVTLAHHHPDRVDALIAIEPGVPYLGRPQPHWVATAPHWEEILEDPTGWELNNRHVYVTRHRDWIEFFFGQQLVEPHSTKQYEDAVAWALESTGKVLTAGEEGFDEGLPDRETVEVMCRSLRVPTLTIHGDLDVCQHVDRGREFARITGGELLVMEGAGHLTPAREPVKVNRAIRRFVDDNKELPMPSQTWTRGLNRGKKVLYLSSPIGLGHVRRDVAIVKELQAIGARCPGRLAGPTPGHHGPRSRGRDDPPRQRVAGQRVGPHRLGVHRSRASLFPGPTTDGRDPGRQLHGLPGGGGGGELRRGHRRRSMGRRLLLAREPRAEAGLQCVAHRLRRLPPDARRRRARGVPHRRLQRRDDRAHRQVPPDPRPGRIRGQSRRRGPGDLRARPAQDPGLDRGALRLLRLHHRVHPAHARGSR